MRRPLISSWLLSVCLLFAAPASAQVIVHALSGTVVKLDPQAKTLLLNTDDGSGGEFKLVSSSAISLQFNRDVRAAATPSESFDKTNAQVVVFYYGNDTVRNAVAVQDLGAGPFVKSSGTVVKVNKHDHSVTIKDAAGKSETFLMGPKAVADTPDGVMPANRFEPEKGDNISVIATTVNGVETALFLHD